jgi:hypothetical protein
MQRADYDQAVEAARRWIAEHDRYPQQQEWEHWVPGRPTTRTIKRRWGWEELMQEAAGDGRLGPEREIGKVRRLELLCTLRRAREALGRWPSAGEWEFATPEARLSAQLRAPIRFMAARLPNGGAAEAVSSVSVSVSGPGRG